MRRRTYWLRFTPQSEQFFIFFLLPYFYAKVSLNLPNLIPLHKIILGIESSCDDTGVAIYDSAYAKKYNKCRSKALHSQIETHAKYGGVVPELASRDHIIYLQKLTHQCLQEASLTLQDIDGFAYTQGPGLAGALLTGASYTKALALGLKKPCVGIHHMEGHLLSPMLEHSEIQPPFLGVLISGGHTLLVEVQALGHYQIIGQSIDDAIGEAFDKSAKLLGLGYPGGYPLSQLAKKGNGKKYLFPRPMTAKAGSPLSPENRFNFSFSGLKTEVKNTYRRELQNNPNEQQTQQIKADIAASFEEAVAETLSIKIKTALTFLNTDREDKQKPKIKSLLVAGGVAANEKIRQNLQQTSEQMNVQLFIPSPHLCTDNGEMIAYVGWLRLNHLPYQNRPDNAETQIFPRWNLNDLL